MHLINNKTIIIIVLEIICVVIKILNSCNQMCGNRLPTFGALNCIIPLMYVLKLFVCVQLPFFHCTCNIFSIGYTLTFAPILWLHQQHAPTLISITCITYIINILHLSTTYSISIEVINKVKHAVRLLVLVKKYIIYTYHNESNHQ